MATISKLSASLTLNSQAFEARLRSARKGLSSFGSGVARAARRVAVLGAASTAAAVGGLAMLTRSSMSTIDSTAKMADVLGLTLDQMRGYQLAAQLAGVGTAELETGFRRLQKNISDARLGLTTAQRAFDALGVSVDYLNGLTPDQQFKVVADALRNVTSQADRARVAQDLLGRSGIKLIKLMETGSAGIAAVQERSRMLRGELTRIDASKIEDANDRISELKTAITGVGDVFAVQIAPTISELAKMIVGALPAIRAWVANFITIQKNIASVVSDFFGLNDMLASDPRTVEAMEKRLADLERRRDNQVRHFGRTQRTVELEKEIALQRTSLELLRKFNETRTGRLIERRRRQAEQAGGMLPGAGMPTLGSLAEDSVNMQGISDAVDDGIAAIETITQGTEQYTSATDAAASATNSLAESIHELAEAQRDFTGMGRAVGRFEQIASVASMPQITNPNEGLGPPQVFDEAATNRLNAAALLVGLGIDNRDKRNPLDGETAEALLKNIATILQQNTMRASYAP